MTVYEYTAYVRSDDGPGITLDRINTALRTAGLTDAITYTRVTAPKEIQP